MSVRACFRRFVRDEAGGPAIEYMLMATLVAMTILVGLLMMNERIEGTYETISESLP